MMGSWEGRGNQYIYLVKVLYCKLPTNGKQLPAFQLEVRPGPKPQSQTDSEAGGECVMGVPQTKPLHEFSRNFQGIFNLKRIYS